MTTGSGSGQPTGIVTALTGGSSEVSPASGGAFAAADVYAVDEALPARYRGNSSWLASRQILNDIAQFETTNGALKFPTIQGRDPSLLNRPAYEASDMSSTVTTGEHVLLLGDWSNFVIADRIGTVVEFIPHLFATSNNRPSGSRGWYAFYRVGADSVNDGAFRVLQL